MTNHITALGSERAVLGCLMLDGQRLDDVLEILAGPVVFADEAHATIYAAMLRLHADKVALDENTLLDALMKTGQLEAAGGMLTVATLSDTVPTSTHALDYARVVADAAVRRQAVRLCGDIVRMAEDGVPAPEVLESAERGLFALSGGGARDKGSTLFEIIPQALQEIDALARRDFSAIGVTTGLDDLDGVLGGLRNGEMITLGGRPSTGKTALALHISRHAAHSGVGVLVISMEMGKCELVRRLLQAEGAALMNRIEIGYQAEPERRKVADAAQVLAQLPITIVEGRQTTASIRSAARRFKAKHERALIVLDYIQLICSGHGKNTQGRYERFSDVSNDIKALAREVNAPVLALAQLNRDAKNASNGFELLSHLKESGSIEQDSDLVIMLSPIGQDADGYGREPISLTVAKNRRGIRKDVGVLYEKNTQRFLNLNGLPSRPPAKPAPARRQAPTMGTYDVIFEEPEIEHEESEACPF